MPVAPSPSTDPGLDAQVLWMRYRTQVIGAVALLVLALLALAAYRFYGDRQAAAASALLSSAKTTQDYRNVIVRYGRTPAAAPAYLLLAGEERKEKKFTEANATLARFINDFPQHEMLATARMAMAANLESMGKQDEALAMYQQIAAVAASGFNAPFAMLEQVHILEAKGRIDEARRLCETLMTRYRDSYAALQAQQLLRGLKPANTPATPSPPVNSATVSPAPAAWGPPGTRP